MRALHGDQGGDVPGAGVGGAPAPWPTQSETTDCNPGPTRAAPAPRKELPCYSGALVRPTGS